MISLMVEDCPFIFFAPAPHSIVDGLQAFPQFGQGILHPRRDFGKNLALYQAVFFHLPKMLCQYLL